MSNISDFEIKRGVLIRYKGSDAEVVIPNGVTSVGSEAFKKCNSIKSVTIPEGVTRIKDSAFHSCHNLEKIEIPDSVQKIGWGAFDSCSSLESITIPEGVTTIEADTFCDCSSLKSINIPNSVTSIGKRAFSRCYKIKSVIIPDSVTFIGDDNLYSNAAFGSAVFDENTEVIFNSYTLPNYYNGSHRMVFRHTPIQEIMNKDYKKYAANGFLTTKDLSIYDESVIESYKKYFRGKTVNYIDFILDNDKAKIIGRLASLSLLDKNFVDMISTLNISEEVWTILADSASSFASGSGKKASSVTELKKNWEYEKNEDGITITAYKRGGGAVIIPDSIGKDVVTEIGAEAFSPNKDGLKPEQWCLLSGITSVVIPNSITSIGEKAYDHCYNLKSVEIPDSVTYIGASAFAWCAKLKDITIQGSLTRIDDNAFEMSKNLIIHAPIGSIAEEYAKKNNIPFEPLN